MKHILLPRGPRKNQNGNVLIYILIAVALLAALSYAVASSGRNSGGGIDQERANLAAAEILEYSAVIGSAVTQLKLRGCTDTQISFDNSISTTDYENTNAPGNNTCHIFNVNGGGVQYTNPQALWLENSMNTLGYYEEHLFTGNACIDQIGTGTTGCNGDVAAAELMMIIPYLKAEICQEINFKLGITERNAAPPLLSSPSALPSSSEFQGSYASPIRIADGGNIIDGKNAACVELSGAPLGDYIFYKVLIAR